MTLTVDYVAGLFAVPVADLPATRFLADLSPEQRIAELEDWATQLDQFNDRLKIVGVSKNDQGWLELTIAEPYAGKIACRFVDSCEDAAGVKVTPPNQTDVAVLLRCQQEAASQVTTEVAGDVPQLALSPEWTAAIVVQHAKPMYAGWGTKDATAAPYFEQHTTNSAPISLVRARNRMRKMIGGAVIDSGVLAERVAALEAEEMYKGHILLCTTFFPSVFESPTAVKRFYSTLRADAETADLIDRKIEIHRRKWRDHISSFQRVDIIDRAQLQQYLAAPDYYEMPLTHAELLEQLEVLTELITSPNYEICLTPEAVDFPYEVRGPEVQLRSDHRNRGKSRPGKVDGLILRDSATVESFKREFWSTYEMTEPPFKDKFFVLAWLGEQVEYIRPRASFGVAFYGGRPTGIVREIADALERDKITCWRADRDALPGMTWFHALETASDFSLLVIVDGSSELMPWTDRRMQVVVERIAARGVTIIVLRTNGVRDQELPAIVNLLTISYTTASDAAERLAALFKNDGSADVYRLPKPEGEEYRGFFLR